jgi:hypothetical protein
VEALSHPVLPTGTGQAPAAALVRRQALPVYASIGAGVLCLAAAILFGGFRYSGVELNSAVISLAALAAGGMALRRMGLERIGDGTEAIALFSTISLLAPLCAVVMASTNLPLADAALARADYVLFGFEREKLVATVMRWPVFMTVVQVVYHSLVIQPSLLLAVLFATGRGQRGWTLLFAWCLSLAVILLIFPLFPALGSPPYFLDFEETFIGARDGSLRTFGVKALTGIIEFPSFHAAAAVLLGWGFAGAGRLGKPFVLLNVLMFGSALIAGHYLVDLIAGGAIAAGAILLAGRLQNRIGRADAAAVTAAA